MATTNRVGLKMISVQDMQISFLMKWVKNLILNKDAKWATFAYSEFNQMGGDLSIFHSDLEMNQMQGLSCLKNNFWRSVLRAWVQCNSNENVTDDVCFYSTRTVSVYVTTAILCLKVKLSIFCHHLFPPPPPHRSHEMSQRMLVTHFVVRSGLDWLKTGACPRVWPKRGFSHT